ncbi:unnamed protein product [Trichogramma brassicae]|uniref:Uncharacterized protein n=1 Tax=Trichogramma brassicae TaxID=86971 RepID=A0A6H5J0H4_9HYME|nr:unnamed protein product [Trichogramma brassicae]
MSMTDDWVNTEELAETDLLHLLVIPIQRTVESLRDGARRDVQRELHHSLMGQANAPNTVKKKTRSRRDLSRMIRISYLLDLSRLRPRVARPTILTAVPSSRGGHEAAYRLYPVILVIACLLIILYNIFQ